MGPTRDKSVLVKTLGETLEDRFELDPQLTGGGKTEIVSGRDRQLGRSVAVKRATALADDPDVRRIFIEAQIAAQIEHPHVVPLYSLEIDRDGQPAFTMKRVRGETLARHIEHCVEAGDPRQGPYCLARRLEYFLDVCDAVAHAHARSVYHRKLSLESVSLGSFGEVYVTDWGFARLGDSPLVTPIEVTISPLTSGPMAVPLDAQDMAKDQAAEQSDLHALAALLGGLITLTRGPTSPARGRRRPPAPLAAILAAALHDHYPSVRALAEDVRRHLRGEAPVVRPDPWSTRLWKRILRRPTPALAGLLAVIVAIGGGTIAGRIRSLEVEAQEARDSRELTQLTAGLSDRADQIEGLLDEIATELMGLRAMFEALGPVFAVSVAAEPHLTALTRRTSAQRAFVVIDEGVRMAGPAAPAVAKLRASGPHLTWGDPVRRSASEPWIVPLTLALRSPAGVAIGLVGVDVPLAVLTHDVLAQGAARSVRLIDRRGRGIDAEGLIPDVLDPELRSRIEHVVDSDLILRDDGATALARVHTLGWYVVGDKALP